MADLSFKDRMQLEKRFNMGSGYVLDFSNRTFQDFVFESTGRNIYDEKYNRSSGSKANRLRAFWEKESGHLVAKLLDELLDLCQPNGVQPGPDHEQCLRVVQRLQQGAPVEDLEAFSTAADDRSVHALISAVRASIDNDEPEAGLDRLHTFAVQYFRQVCGRYGIETSGKPLQSLVGELGRRLHDLGKLDSALGKEIFRACGRMLTEFDDVRNNQSMAHPNPLPTSNEALMIVKCVCAAIMYVQTLEGDQPAEEAATRDDVFF